jgi:hypothetical protein
MKLKKREAELMTSNPRDERLLRRYLLGKLRGRKVDALERRLLEDDDLFEQCEAIETDLLAASARGELAPAERERVRRRLASSPHGRERLALARSLNAAADDHFAAAPSGNVVPFQRPARALRIAFRPAFVAIAAALVATIGVSWFVWQRPFTDGAHPRVADQRPAPTGPAQPSVPKSPAVRDLGHSQDHLARTEPVVFTLSLMTTRGAGESSQEFPLRAGTEKVEIHLIDIEGLENLGSFHTVVRRRGDGLVWQGALKPRQLEWGPTLVLTIPAEKLSAGRYEVTATAGSGDEMTTEFEVVRGSRG